uniref:G-box-binding factor 1-like isoform X2 n=1 Tax=Erigeron canadensis TaxID=72917 RepID=UPI001CB92851|nr:G-box-binding factor 1-like isoform X2 [Erigeron canadensis]
MGSGEQSSPAKHSKPTSTQETPPPSYHDWQSSMQAYYGSGAAPPFFPSAVASPTPHPYMWGGQHPMMPPYGTPVPYPALYPPAGVYGHPSMPMTPGTMPPNAEMEGKAPNGKHKINKKSKGNSVNANPTGARTRENGKAASSSGNDGATQSAESGNDGSSDASDEDDQQGYSGGKKGSFHQMLADASARNNDTEPNVPGNTVVSMPATNLNMGMDLWNPSAGTGSMKMQPNHSGVPQSAGPPPMMADQWVQDERELKRQKRKQSNRESARRSRLRKQAECEELQARVETLNNENHSLRDELQKLSSECGKLTSENNSIKVYATNTHR